MSRSKYSPHRPAGRQHVPNYPKGFIALRFVQLILAVVVLGLCAYSLIYYSAAGIALSVFTAVATLIITVYSIIAKFGPAVVYNYWAILALDIFGMVFWIASFALLASQVAGFIAGGNTVCVGDYYVTCTTYDLSGTDMMIAGCLCAAAGVGGIEFILFIVSLSVHSVMMHRHRSAGLHNRPISPESGEESGFPAAGPVHGEKPQPLQNVSPRPQYASSYPTAVATPSPVQSQQMYQPPPATAAAAVVQPTSYYPQQQQGVIYQQPAVGQVPGPHMGSHEAQGQPIGHQQQYHPAISPN
ncbi:hypothetical protein KVR01_006611 [Diaporthe batatas]|uniref:uncharacterized protein n=1 Tax=Diaporthe batatas TaxID=748121 RepID=UPI001D0543D5|nr:uncharacterized protein KVR01_006611 [Diaporthe batatas]KAG8163314.1 hypothetical protein KVR01_006611 [Diaporthe batatas]